MIGAVSTLLVQSASLGPVSQVAASLSEAPAPSARGDYVSSAVRMDNLQNKAILEYRSSKTGEVVRQYPTQAQIQAFKRAQASAESSREAVEQVALQLASQGVDGGAAQAVSTPAAAPAPAEVSAPAPAPTAAPAGDAGAGAPAPQSVIV